MNLNKKIGFLLDIGFTPKFVSSLNENKINLLFEKISKKENKEAVTMVSKDDLPTQQKLKTSKQPFQIYEKELEEDEFYTDLSGGKTQEPEDEESPDYPGSDRGKPGEQESLEEKFESKAQQGLFWARCNKCKTDDCKWCKMAKEFSKSTSKKQYKDMPEKKHPEKTVKYKKKETKENFTFKDYLGKLGSTYTSEITKKVNGTTPTFSESIFEKNLENIIQENLKPTMKKRDLLKLIESEIQRKKGLNEDFYYGGQMEEDFDFMKSGPATPVIDPGIKEPGIEEPPTRWSPDEDEPGKINPDTEKEIQGKKKGSEEKKHKTNFDKFLKRMENSNHKPTKYYKF